MESKKPALRSKSGSEKKSGPWRPTKRQVLWTIGMVVALLTTALLIVNLRPEIWKGLLEERNLTLIAIGVSVTAIIVLLAIGGATLRWTGFGDKTFWDWLQLLSALAIPVVLAAAGLWFTAQQDQRQQNIENERAQQAAKIENQRAAAERELAVQRAQDEALQTYIDQMGSLLLEKDLRESKEDSEVRTLARARTLTVLGRLDPTHKAAVMEFLVEAELVQRVEGREPIIRLGRANLSGVVLTDPDEVSPSWCGACYDPSQMPNLRGADLVFANLTNAQLYGADLTGADLSGAYLRDADLRIAFLNGAVLSGAVLSGAVLSSADLSGSEMDVAVLSGANLSRADLSGAGLVQADLSKALLKEADLSGANLGVADLSPAYLMRADLSGAHLSFADLSGADLNRADLKDANLKDANLANTDLRHAKGWTEKQLGATKSLEGAIMPNGQKYEDWLKSKGRGEDEKNE